MKLTSLLPRSRPLQMRLAVALAAVLLAIATQWLPDRLAAFTASEWLRDHFVQARASALKENRLVVIDIDESSLAAAGPWPWPRERIATLIELLLGEYGARGVALDLVMPEPADAGGDARLAMLAQHGPLVMPHAFDYDNERERPLRVGVRGAGIAAPQARDARVASGYISNHEGLRPARYIGNIGFIPDADGMIRRLPMQTWYAGQRYPTLSLALLDCCGPAPRPAAGSGATGGMGDGWGMRRLPYSRAWEAYTVVPAAHILDQRWPRQLIADKLVLIGSSSLGLADRVATPLSPNTSGLLVHAAALTAQLDIRSGQAPAPWPGRLLAIAFGVLVTAGATYTFPRLAAAVNMLLLLAASAAWLALAWLITPHDAVYNTTGPLLVHLFLLLVAVPLAWQRSQRQSRKLLGTLRQYVADAVVDELLRSNLEDPLEPRRGEVTTLIADMEGYTNHVAALPVEAAAQLTRDFLDCLTGPVLERHGTLDKFTGDGLVAFWGAPLPVADHADQALDAALAIIQAVRRFNQLRAAQGLRPVRVRIGIESGEAMAGDFGSATRSIYTAVGDSVNVASRLESAARDLPHDVIIGPGTAALSKRHILTRLGDITLRGKDHHTTLYTLKTLADAAVAA